MANSNSTEQAEERNLSPECTWYPVQGKVTINKRDIDEYLGLETLKVIVRQPLAATETADKFDVLVNVRGGGYTGQAGAIRHGIARALLQADPDYRPDPEEAGYLTRDPRMKERKKYGLKAARPRSAVQQALNFIKSGQKPRNYAVSWVFPFQMV